MTFYETISVIVAGVAVVVSVCLLIITKRHDGKDIKHKNFELTTTYYEDVTHWHSEVIMSIMKLNSGILEKKERLIENSKLFAYAETGRFYFPNEIIDAFGQENPAGHQGYRQALFDCLLIIYGIFLREDYREYSNTVKDLQRKFSSYVHLKINPNEYNKALRGINQVFSREKEDIFENICKDIITKNPELKKILPTMTFLGYNFNFIYNL